MLGVALLGATLTAAAAAFAGCSSKDSTPAAATPGPRMKEYPPTGQTKTFDLTISEFDWEVAPGAIYDAIGYNKTLPGPVLEVNAGDHVVIHLTNASSEPHSIHTHVVRFPEGSDGVKYGIAEPGKTVTVQWDAVYAGTFPYHDHVDEAAILRGLYGALVVHAPDEAPAAHENVVVLADFDIPSYRQLPGVGVGDAGPSDVGDYRGGHQYMHGIDGHAYTEWTPHFQAKSGDLVRWRVISMGLEFHTFHIHGHRWTLPDGEITDNVTLGPGTYTTFEFVEDNPGDWLYHCHVQTHMEGGMMGWYSVSK